MEKLFRFKILFEQDFEPFAPERIEVVAPDLKSAWITANKIAKEASDSYKKLWGIDLISEPKGEVIK